MPDFSVELHGLQADLLTESGMVSVIQRGTDRDAAAEYGGATLDSVGTLAEEAPLILAPVEKEAVRTLARPTSAAAGWWAHPH